MPPTVSLFSLGDSSDDVSFLLPGPPQGGSVPGLVGCRSHNNSTEPTTVPPQRRLLYLSSDIRPVVRPHGLAAHQAGAVNTGGSKSVELKPPIATNHVQTIPTPTEPYPFVTAEHASFIPNPTPFSGTTRPDAQGYGYPLANPAPAILTGRKTTQRRTRTSGPTGSYLGVALSTFSGLPPLPSRISSALDSASHSGERSTPTISTSPSFEQPTDDSPTPRTLAVQAPRLDGLVMIFIAVGVFLFLLGVGFVVRITLQRRKRSHPTPSLPILRDGDNFGSGTEKADDSPLFGGKERFSPLPATGPNWAWVQYTRPAQLSNQSLGNAGASTEGEGRPYVAVNSMQPTIRPQSTPQDLSIQKPYNHPSYLQLPPKSTNRLSTITASFYSPQTAYANIGIAISTLPDETTGPSATNEAPTKTKRKSQLQAMRHESLTSCSELPYDDKESSDDHVDSEPPVARSAPHIPEGRPRVHSGYFPAGAFPPLSSTASAPFSITTATKIKVGQRNSMGKGLPLQRSNSKRLRETQALTYALGLTTPRPENAATSPHETLYPDDSMSIADARSAKPSSQKAAVHAHDAPPITTSRDGFRSQGALHKNMRTGTSESKSAQSFESEVRVARLVVRNADRPPRVPSPPPLPSLAQMTLAHNNPEGYENYRSPTYSIYGLYEPKSGR